MRYSVLIESLHTFSLFVFLGLAVSSTSLAQNNGSNGTNGQPFQLLQEQIDLLTQRLNALETETPVSLTVDCNAGETVGAALDSVSSTTPVDITVSGRCSESLMIRRDDVTIKGATAADGFTGIGPGFINGPSRILLRDLTIDATGARWGVGCFHGSVVELDNVEIIGGKYGVLLVDGGQCRILNTLIRGATWGVFSMQDSLADLEGSTEVRNSANAGVRATQGGNVRIQGSTITNNNIGVQATGGSHISVSGGTIENNNGDGLKVSWGATARTDFNTSIRSNGGNGITVEVNSTIILFGNLNISNNSGWGIQCTADSGFVGTPPVSGNTLGGIDCP